MRRIIILLMLLLLLSCRTEQAPELEVQDEVQETEPVDVQYLADDFSYTKDQANSQLSALKAELNGSDDISQLTEDLEILKSIKKQIDGIKKELDSLEMTGREGYDLGKQINEYSAEFEDEIITIKKSIDSRTNVEETEMKKDIVVLETSKGVVELSLNPQKAPITVANFLQYLDKGFYDGTIFHRVINNFMIQGGSFSSGGKEKQMAAPIKLESNNGLKNKAGTVAMARTNDPDSARSGFYINTVDNAFLDYSSSNPGYAVFGKVISGMDVVHEIEKVKTQNMGVHQDWPVDEIKIIKAYRK